MTYNILSKLNDGNDAYKTYLDTMLSYTGQDIRNEKHFKLCNKSKKKIMKNVEMFHVRKEE